MNRSFGAWSAAVGAVGMLTFSGCDTIIDSLQPQTVTVRLVNNADFNVDIVLYTGDDQDVTRELLTEVGDEEQFTIPSGETTSFQRNCDELQAIVIDRADLVLLGEIGPETETDILRDGDDFSCGEILVFTFDHSGAIVDFDVVFTREQNDPGL